MDYDRFKSDIKATFDLLDDIKSGDGLNWDRINKFFESPLFKRKDKTTRSDKFSSFPRFGSSKSTTESSETDSGDEVFSSRTFRRSDSTYSTSSYDTTDSNETVSGESSSSRFQKREAKVERQIPVHHYRTVSSSSTQGLSKRLEDQFLNEERHSMPHEIYACDREGQSDRLFRPVSAPPKTDPLLIRTQFSHDNSSGFKCFPSRVLDSHDGQSDANLNRVRVSPNTVKNNYKDNAKQSALVRPEICRTTSRLDSKDTSLPDILKKDGSTDNGPPSFGLETNDNRTWPERQDRIECALKWLRSELIKRRLAQVIDLIWKRYRYGQGLLRAQDKVLLSQLKRCQDTIEVIKKQREEFSEIDEDDEGHWEDWEIAEFDRRCENGEIIDDLPTPCQQPAMPNNAGIIQDVQVKV